MKELCENCANLVTWEISPEESKYLGTNDIKYCAANVSNRKKCVLNKEKEPQND